MLSLVENINQYQNFMEHDNLRKKCNKKHL